MGSTNYKKRHQVLQSQRKKKSNNYIICTRSIFRKGERVAQCDVPALKNNFVGDDDIKNDCK